MCKEEKKDLKKNLDYEVEKKLDTLWNNWASRRKCESTHVPEYVRKNHKIIKNE